MDDDYAALVEAERLQRIRAGRPTLVVGMCDPRATADSRPLDPARGGSAGHRLWSVVDGRYGVTQDEWRSGLAFANLCHREWDRDAAETEADRLLDESEQYARLVLLGGEVARAFAARREPQLSWVDHPAYLLHVLKLPHPSGLCRAYNDPAVRAQVADLLHTELLRGLGLYARASERVTCEAGHDVCGLSGPVRLGSVPRAVMFVDWAEESGADRPEKGGRYEALLCGCGAPYARAAHPRYPQTSAVQLHVGPGWR